MASIFLGLNGLIVLDAWLSQQTPALIPIQTTKGFNLPLMWAHVQGSLTLPCPTQGGGKYSHEGSDGTLPPIWDMANRQWKGHWYIKPFKRNFSHRIDCNGIMYHYTKAITAALRGISLNKPPLKKPNKIAIVVTATSIFRKFCRFTTFGVCIILYDNNMHILWGLCASAHISRGDRQLCFWVFRRKQPYDVRVHWVCWYYPLLHLYGCGWG